MISCNVNIYIDAVQFLSSRDDIEGLRVLLHCLTTQKTTPAASRSYMGPNEIVNKGSALYNVLFLSSHFEISIEFSRNKTRRGIDTSRHASSKPHFGAVVPT